MGNSGRRRKPISSVASYRSWRSGSRACRPRSSRIRHGGTTIAVAARQGKAGDRHGSRARQAASRRLLHHHPDHVPGPGHGARPAGDPAPRALAGRPGHRRPLRHLPGRRCGRRLLDHDLRRAGAGGRDRGRGGGRPGAGGDGGADHLDHGAAPTGQGGGAPGLRVHPGQLPVLLPPHRGGLLRACLRGGRRRRHRHHPLQHLLDLGRRLVRAGRAAGRAGAGAGRAEMGLPAHRRHGVRGRRRTPSRRA